MQLAQEKDGQHMRTSGTQKKGGSDFPLLQSFFLFHQRHGVVMDGVRDLVRYFRVVISE
jgi:hypothetical protein